MEKISRRKLVLGALGAAAALPEAAQGQFDWMKPEEKKVRVRESVVIAPDNPAILHHPMNCEMCGDCVAVCHKEQTVYGYGKKPNPNPCVWCGQCVANCWYNGVTESFSLSNVLDQMEKNRTEKTKKTFIAITSPAVRVAIGEMFQMPPGTNMQGQVVTALRELGFDYVFDVAFGADLAVMEEAHDLTEMIRTHDPLRPMFSSCCPSWIRFTELFYPKYVPYISTCKSPILMQGAVIKSYFAAKKHISPHNIVLVAITPCTAKKGEIRFPYAHTACELHGDDNVPDVDFALTTRELGWWLSNKRLSLAEMEIDEPDSITGQGSGAGVLFGGTGGVTESILRTVYYNLTGKKPLVHFLNLTAVRGMDGLRKAEVRIGEHRLRVGIVHGLGVMRKLFDVLDAMKFDFVEVMACRGGCIGGGGQPKTEIPLTDALRLKRIQGLHETDKNHSVRFSYENPEIQRIYYDYLSNPGSELAIKLLHTL